MKKKSNQRVRCGHTRKRSIRRKLRTRRRTRRTRRSKRRTRRSKRRSQSGGSLLKVPQIHELSKNSRPSVNPRDERSINVGGIKHLDQSKYHAKIQGEHPGEEGYNDPEVGFDFDDHFHYDENDHRNQLLKIEKEHQGSLPDEALPSFAIPETKVDRHMESIQVPPDPDHRDHPGPDHPDAHIQKMVGHLNKLEPHRNHTGQFELSEDLPQDVKESYQGSYNSLSNELSREILTKGMFHPKEKFRALEHHVHQHHLHHHPDMNDQCPECKALLIGISEKKPSIAMCMDLDSLLLMIEIIDYNIQKHFDPPSSGIGHRHNSLKWVDPCQAIELYKRLNESVQELPRKSVSDIKHMINHQARLSKGFIAVLDKSLQYTFFGVGKVITKAVDWSAYHKIAKAIAYDTSIKINEKIGKAKGVLKGQFEETKKTQPHNFKERYQPYRRYWIEWESPNFP